MTKVLIQLSNIMLFVEVMSYLKYCFFDFSKLNNTIYSQLSNNAGAYLSL